MSRLDALVEALLASPQDEQAARAFYAAFAGSELCLLLADEAQGDKIAPKIFPLETGPVVLVFDSEERLTDFAGPAPFAALAGRALAQLLNGQGLGAGLNLGGPAEYVLPAEAIVWIAEHEVAPRVITDPPLALHPPSALPAMWLPEIEARLAAAQGLAEKAVFADAAYGDGSRRVVLGFLGAQTGAEVALSALIGEAIALSGGDPSATDIVFPATGSALAARLQAVGLVVDIPEPPKPAAPDPSKPPKLR